MASKPSTLLCLGHLGWEHVWQRPQHLMTRFANHCRVIYIDPPELIKTGDRAWLEERPGSAGVRVLRPKFPEHLMDFGTGENNGYQRMWLSLLPGVLADAGPDTVLWVTSPRADYLVAVAQEHVRLAVYDCMDELAGFKDGSDDMHAREDQLLSLVDLLFTGGQSMFESRKDRHPRAYCFPSGVDVEHFRSASAPETQVPNVIAQLPRPRLGYFGVLDERIGWPLIEAIAARRPDWHWLMVGPVVKVEPEDLPVAPNIHYLGQQQYAELPAFLKGFDIATMPFALNQATRFISPTKTPEYLAGGKQVISSLVPDVVATYKDIVYLADSAEGWISTIEQMLVAPPEERSARLQRAEPMLKSSSWDSIAERMWTLIEEQLQAQSATDQAA